jgi:CHASE2 domain-containing sensor protein
MLKAFMIIAPSIAIGLIFIMYKREDSLKRVIFSFSILWYVVTLALLGMIMLSLKFLFMLHMAAIVIAYLSLLYYIIRNRFLLLPLFGPLVTMSYYLILVWVGNETLPSSIF